MVLDGSAPGDAGRELPPAAAPSPEQLYYANLRVIDALITHIARRYHLASAERDEFGSEVHLRLIENEFEVLRRFRHESKVRTYLATVIKRLFLDYCNRVWGKWRSSAEARRLGPAAKRLERLVVRDGFTFDEAVSLMRMNEGYTQTREELREIFERLPVRTPKRFISDQVLEEMAAPSASSEEAMLAREQSEAAARAQAALKRALDALPAQDRLIMELRYTNDLTIAKIARMMRLDQKPLYRRLTRIKEDLRAALEAQGITAPDVFGGYPEDDDPDAG